MYTISNKGELVILLAEAVKGDRMSQAKLKEAVSTSDLPELFRQVTSWAMKEQYARLPSIWRQFAMPWGVNDFRPQRFMEWNLLMGQLLSQNGGAARKDVLALPRVQELTEYPTFQLEAREELFGINKYGARFPFSFEMFINDEFNVITSLPGEMAGMAVDTEDVLATSVLAGPDGPNPAMFNANWQFGDQVPNGNILEGNPALSIEAVEAALQSIRMRTIRDRPVRFGPLALVVPPSLEIKANEIATISNFLRVETDDDGIERRFTVTNTARGRITPVVNDWLPRLDTSETSATTWYLVPLNGQNLNRPAIVVPQLNGYENPELRISGNTGNYVGGGEVPGTEGSFLNDDVQYRVRHFTNAVGVDPSATMVSLGTGDES
jgi:hypothetical protein